MIEGHDFIDAYFTNNEKTVVETVWYSPEEDTHRTHVIKAEEGNKQWESLLKKIDIDQIHENTYNRIRNMRQAYENELLSIARANGELKEYKSNIDTLQEAILDYFDQNIGNEDLFKMKLRTFEREKVKKSEDRSLKGKLRKAKTLAEVIEIYNKF